MLVPPEAHRWCRLLMIDRRRRNMKKHRGERRRQGGEKPPRGIIAVGTKTPIKGYQIRYYQVNSSRTTSERQCSVFSSQFKTVFLPTSGWIESLLVGGHAPFSPNEESPSVGL